MPARRDREGQWRYRKVVQLPGGGKERISGTPAINTKLDAERAEHEHIRRVLVGLKKGGDCPKFSDFAARYMEVAVLEQAPSEIAGKRQRLARIINPALGDLRLDRIGRAELDAIKVALSGRKPRTINNYLAVVGAVLEYAVECGMLDDKPDMGMLAVAEQDFEVYSDDEIDAMVRVTVGHERTAILLGADAGLRAGEHRALRREDVGARNVRILRSEWFGEIKAPKGGKPRTVPMTDRLQEAVTRSLKSHASPTVLVRDNGMPWSREVMRARIARITRAAGVENRGWHALRHAFGTRLAARGVALRTIQALMGHASITTTERYTHLIPGATEMAVAALQRSDGRGNNVAKEETAKN